MKVETSCRRSLFYGTIQEAFSRFFAVESLFFFGAGASRPFDIPTMMEMVSQFRKELSESKSLGIDEEVRLYDVNASPALPGPSFLSAHPIRYDDCTD